MTDKDERIEEIRHKHSMHVFDGYEDDVHSVIGYLLEQYEQQKAEIARMQEEHFETSRTAFNNVNYMMDQRNSANDRIEELQDELQQSREENERLQTALHTHKSYDNTASELHEENERLRTRFDKETELSAKLVDVSRKEIVEADAWCEYWRREAFRKYPTPDAYDAACAALEKHRRESERLRGELGMKDGEVDQYKAWYYDEEKKSSDMSLELDHLRQKLKDYEGCKGIEDFYTVRRRFHDCQTENERLRKLYEREREIAEKAQEEARKLREERDDQAEACHNWHKTANGYLYRIETLQQERERLIAGLRWYGTKGNYYQPKPFYTPFAEVDKGKIARDILSELGIPERSDSE